MYNHSSYRTIVVWLLSRIPCSHMSFHCGSSLRCRTYQRVYSCHISYTFSSLSTLYNFHYIRATTIVSKTYILILQYFINSRMKILISLSMLVLIYEPNDILGVPIVSLSDVSMDVPSINTKPSKSDR